MSDSHIFPQPTEGQLNEGVSKMIPLNPFWWGIVQGELRNIDNRNRWVDYEAVESAIQELFIGIDVTP